MVLNDQLETYMIGVRLNGQFSDLKGTGDLEKIMVGTKKHIVSPIVYLLVTFILILLVATATMERTFFAMNIVKFWL